MSLPIDSLLFWALALLGVILTGISKSGFAGGAGVVAVPLIALTTPLPEAVALMLPLLIAMDIKTINYYRKHIALVEVKRLLPAAVVGIVAGGFAIGQLSEQLLQWLLGILSVVFALWQQLLPQLRRLTSLSWLWGGVSGLTSTLIHAGGPPLNIYLIARELPKLTWLATAAVFFGVMNVIKIVPYSLNGQWSQTTLLASAALLPAALIGVKLGHRLQQRVSEKQFMLLCRSLLLLSGLALIAKAMWY